MFTKVKFFFPAFHVVHKCMSDHVQVDVSFGLFKMSIHNKSVNKLNGEHIIIGTIRTCNRFTICFLSCNITEWTSTSYSNIAPKPYHGTEFHRQNIVLQNRCVTCMKFILVLVIVVSCLIHQTCCILKSIIYTCKPNWYKIHNWYCIDVVCSGIKHIIIMICVGSFLF